jgi:uncharacterized membrane protein YkgB
MAAVLAHLTRTIGKLASSADAASGRNQAADARYVSFLATTPEAWQEGQGMPQLSMLGEALLKDSVLLGAALLTGAESLRAAHAGNRS